ncbi:MAG: hypothetical protein ACRC1K_02950, partial [Planctomycetia bacterium]
MFTSAFLAVAFFGSPGRLMLPEKPPVDLVGLRNDLVLVQSNYHIHSIYLPGLCERYHYFVEFSTDGRQATVLLRTTANPVRVVVETSVGGVGMYKHQEFLVKNTNSEW